MKGILFLVAVFLAWPTMGISLLIFFGWFAVDAYVIEDLKRQKRQREAACRRLTAGEGHPPTWANNADDIEAFMGTTVDLAVRKGVPRSFLQSLTPAQKNSFVNYMGLLEDQGANNRHQGVAAGAFIDALWAEAQRAKPARSTEETPLVLQPVPAPGASKKAEGGLLKNASPFPTPAQPVPAPSAPKDWRESHYITTRETRKGWQVVWMRPAGGGGFEPYRSGAGFYKSQKEAQIETEMWADDGLPIR